MLFIQGDLNPTYAQTGERQELASASKHKNNIQTLTDSCKQTCDLL